MDFERFEKQHGFSGGNTGGLGLIKHLIWRRLDLPGHEALQLIQKDGSWELSGTAVFIHEHKPCKLDYQVACDSAWNTRAARVNGWVGDQVVDCEIRVDPDQHIWWLNGVDQPQVAGCIDLDLNFSPVTNTLPIRRLALPTGQLAHVQAAWLRFPDFQLVPLEQIYRHIDEMIYRYESGGGSFRADLSVDPDGLVRHYPGAWRMEG
jgi:uncharacterized protein